MVAGAARRLPARTTRTPHEGIVALPETPGDGA
jgi:hypothetical protein